MSLPQFEKFAADYGFGFALLIAIVLLIVLVRKLWPMISSFVNLMNLLGKLDTRLGNIETTLGSNTTKLDDTITKIDTHIADAKKKTDLLYKVDARLGLLDDKAADIKHEVKNNGGSSLKDSVHRNEDGLAQALDILRRLDPAGSTGTYRLRPPTGPVFTQE